MAFVGRRYIYDAKLKQMVEVGADYDSNPCKGHGRLTSEGEQYDGLRATDGTDISSRKKRREFMKRNGLTDPSDYGSYKKDGSFLNKALEARRKHFSGEVDTSGGRRRADLARRLFNK